MSQHSEFGFSSEEQFALELAWSNANRRADLARQQGVPGIGHIALGQEVTTSYVIKSGLSNVPDFNQSVTGIFRGVDAHNRPIFTLPLPETVDPVMQVEVEPDGFGPMGASAEPAQPGQTSERSDSEKSPQTGVEQEEDPHYDDMLAGDQGQSLRVEPLKSPKRPIQRWRQRPTIIE